MPSLSSSAAAAAAVSASSSSTSKIISTTTAPNSYFVATSSSEGTMVVSSTLTPSSVDPKPSSLSILPPCKSSITSSSDAYSDLSNSFGYEENFPDSLFYLMSSITSNYVLKHTVNTTSTTTPNTNTSSISTTSVKPQPSIALTPQVKVTVQQSSLTTPPLCTDSSSFLKTPSFNSLPISSGSNLTTKTALSAPEFSVSSGSNSDHPRELASYEQYLSISFGKQSNPSSKVRKKAFEETTKAQQITLPRSRSEINTLPIDQSQQQQTTTSRIRTVSKFFPYI